MSLTALALAATGSVAAEGGEENVLIPHADEVIIGLIAFGLLCYVLMTRVFPRMERTFRERRDAIEGGIERAEAAQNEAQRTLEQYRAQLAEARTEAAQIRDNARQQGQQIVEELRTQAREESERILTRGREQLAAERQQIVQELRADIGRLSVDLAGRIVGESLEDDARRRGTVERFLDDLDGGRPSAGAVVTQAEPR